MAIYIVYSNTTDGWLTSGTGGSGYADTQSGVGEIVVSNNVLRMGQYHGNYYYIYESFLSFDTSSIPSSEVIVAASMHLTVSDSNNFSGKSVDVSADGWGTPLTASDWVSVGPTGTYRTLASVGQAIPNGVTTLSADLLLSNITKGGTSKFVGTSARAINGQAPSTSGAGIYEFLEFYSATSGTSTAPVLLIQTLVPSTMVGVSRDSVQLSTGETVVVRSDGNATSPTWTLGYYTLGTTTFNTISTMTTGGTQFYGNSLGMERLSLCVDASDNLYVVGTYAGTNSSLLAQAFVKGSGLSWTAKTGLLAALPHANAGTHALSAEWVPGIVNTPGGIVVYVNRGLYTLAQTQPARSVDIATLDASVLLSGSGTLMVKSANDTSWLTNPIGDGLSHVDLKLLPGTASPTVCMANAGTDTVNGSSFRAGTVTLDSTGNYVTQNGFKKNYSIDDLGAESRIEIVPISATNWAVLASSGGSLCCWLFNQNGDNTSATSLPTTSNQPNFATSGAWSALYDATTGNIWVYYVDATNAQRIARVSFAVNSLVWTSTDVTVNSSVGATGTTNRVLRAVRYNDDERFVLIDAANINGSTLSTVSVTDSFNQAPNAPSLGSIRTFDSTLVSPTFSWTFSDPNPKDSQSKYEVEIDNNSTGASAYRSGVVTSTTNSITLPATTLANNITYRWRVRTYDYLGATGTWSDYSTFSTSSTGTATITDPSADYPSGLITSYYNFKWSYSNSGSATQQAYQLKLIRLSDSSTVYDSGVVNSTATNQTITGIPSDTPLRLDLTITNTASQVTPAVSRYFQTSYDSPDQITTLAAQTQETGYVNLTWTLPTPTGSKPAITTVDVYRSINGGTTWTNIDSIFADEGSYSDGTAPSGSTPIYILKQESETGYAWSVKATASAPVLVTGVMIAIKNQTDGSAPWSSFNLLAFNSGQTQDTLSVATTQLQFAGRANPVTEFGEYQTEAMLIKATIPFQGNPVFSVDDMTYADATSVLFDPNWGLLSLMRQRTTIVVRDRRGRVVFGTIASLQFQDQPTGFDLQMNVSSVDYVEGETVTTVGN